MTAPRSVHLAAALCAFSVVAEPSQVHEQRVEHQGLQQPSARFPSGTSVVEVPFRFDVGKILVDVKVNGSEPITFVLDTGAPSAVLLKPEKVEGIENQVIGEAHVMGAGSSDDSQTAQYAQGIRLDIGGLRLEGLGMILMPASDLKHLGDLPWGGIFGGQLFANVVVEIDWKSSRLRLHDPATYEAPTGATAVPLEIRRGHVYVPGEVTIDGEPQSVRLVVDTGASHALSLTVDKIPSLHLSHATLGRGLNGILKGDLGRIDLLKLGDSSFQGVVTSFPDSTARNIAVGADGNLGTEVLRRFVVTFDYARNRMLLEPTDAIAEPFRFPTTGMRIRPKIAEGGSVVIDDVYPDSPAARAGLSAGDRIVTVNSRPVGDLDLDAIRDQLSQAPGTIVTLGIQQTESVRKVELKLETIL